MTKLTDEECIALASLHGCGFYCQKDLDFTHDWWTVGPWDDDPHEIESAMEHEPHNYPCSAFKSREELARAYCKHYGLLDEVTS